MKKLIEKEIALWVLGHAILLAVEIIQVIIDMEL